MKENASLLFLLFSPEKLQYSAKCMQCHPSIVKSCDTAYWYKMPKPSEKIIMTTFLELFLVFTLVEATKLGNLHLLFYFMFRL
jgi:hypothetical protein